MKNFFVLCFLLITGINFQISAQESEMEVPGDHFDLNGALDLFKKSESPEGFEKALNTEGNFVNNLDLNGDGDIDYIQVVEKMDGDIHVLVLQVAVSESESQDIAVIEIEKDGKESATIQIVGDEDIYGSQSIVEPYDDAFYNPDTKQYETKQSASEPAVVNVWLWPSVRYIYAPSYRPWISPFRWRVYPSYWRPWRPHPILFFRTHRPVHVGFRIAPVHRVVRAHRVYVPVRRHSVVVHTKYRTNVEHRRTHTTVKTTKKTTKVERGHGKTTVTKTKKTRTTKRK